MAKQVRSVDFLPEIFKTPINEQFLSATLDQLIQNPRYVQSQGFVGRRIGPGVNANDSYVTEPTKVRTDYQLEPGVVQANPENTSQVVDAITYPGINDALQTQGAFVNNADRLYTSDYYAWDPFVDLDKFVNYAQYYWLPGGPLSVDVSATTVPETDNFVVDRAAGVYTFSGVAGNNPEITLVRGGTYTFQVAQNTKETENFRVTNNDLSSWNVDYSPNPTLTLVRGNTYVFNIETTPPLAFYIKTAVSLGTTDIYTPGVTGNGASAGLITFTVPQDAPDTLFYCNDVAVNLNGQLNIVDGQPGTGPGFFIQADPGVDGRLIATPNISSRDVLGVVNNGEDLGTVTFNVPLATAQNFYYNMPSIGTVDLITSLDFDQINNVPVAVFLEQYGGIDGITNLQNRTLVFEQTSTGWEQTVLGDPFVSTAITDPAVQYGVWQMQYNTIDGTQFIQLVSIQTVDVLNKFTIIFGVQYSSTAWYKNEDGVFEQIPLLTAGLNVLYYQDGTDPEIFGRFKLIDIPDATLDIENIIGATTYSSPNGVVFSNGMKVIFRGNVYPATYQNQEYYVEGVGTGPGLPFRVGFVDGEAYYGPYHVHLGQKMVGAEHTDTFHQYIYDTLEQSQANIGAGGPAGAPLSNQGYTVIGNGIKLLPVTSFVTPETYTDNLEVPYDTTPYDVGNFDGNLNQPLVPDYLTINRASPDLNAWTRSNRWFHIDVITASAAYNNTAPLLDNQRRARRPVLEFRAGTRLFNSGTQALSPVNVVDETQTDALSNVNGSLGYNYSGYNFINGTVVVFAADIDPEVRRTIYRVEFAITNTNAEDSTIVDVPVIILIPVGTAAIDNTVVCLNGIECQGVTFVYDGVNWIEAQQKISVNQPPRFDIYDSNGISFGNQATYPSSSFTGSPLFSYAVGDGDPDLILGFPLTYLSLTNIGDIVFDNNFYRDTFQYTLDSAGQTLSLSTGFVREYSMRGEFQDEIGWQTAATTSLIRQQFQFTYDGAPLLLDVAVNNNDTVPAIQIYANGQYQSTDLYTYTVGTNTTTIRLLGTYQPGDLIEVSVLSDQVSVQGFYEVPINLSNNALNGDSPQFTLGTIRNHYASTAENLIGLSGPPIGANNTRDLGNIIPYGLQILQQSSPLTLAGYFMRDPDYDIFASLTYNSAEYIKFKSQLLNAVTTFGISDYGNWTVAELLDRSMAQITAGRTNLNPFYWSDMVPTGTTFVSNTYTVNPITTNTFNTVQTYDFTQANFLGLCVYVNNVLLTRGVEYVVSTEGPALTILIPLAVGAVVKINEYTDTAGNFVPNTPTKLGLYPKYQPRLFYDTSYVNPAWVIQGHDGSITVAFGTPQNPDPRDQVLLEFETRIFSNLKTDDNPVPLVAEDVIPGYFRTTGYDFAEVNQILGESFLAWVGGNKLDYTAQTYVATDPFTYNWSQAGNRLDNKPLLGAWRGIYRYWYDTTSPDTTPWEMLGFSEQPKWWTDRYGPTPYTSDNLVLWGDLEAGLVADPAGFYVIPKYVRPGLTSVIPVDSQGQLISPLYSVVGAYNPQGFVKSWQVGDGGPVEASWWSSSSYPFAVMRLLILTRPAEFFSLFADRDLYRYHADFDQYLYRGRYRIQPQLIQVYGDGVSKASYINWIVDYNQQQGINSTTALTTDLANLDIRLCYRMAGFVAQSNLDMYLEKSSPNSENSNLLIPPESYNLLLYKNTPFSRINYSAVIVEVVEGGYTVYGYNATDPYFPTLASRVTGIQQTLSGGNVSVTVPSQYTDKLVQIPYGYIFANLAGVVDFLLSYGEYLASQGLSFTAQENGYTLNWLQMAQEFLYFANQGWATGTIINLNPSATQAQAFRAGAVLDSVTDYTPENLVLDQNRRAFDAKNLVIRRQGNTFTLNPEPGGSQTVSYLRLQFTAYENMVVLDNRTIFNDLIYNSYTAERQSRLRLSAAMATEWNGTVNAQGFILNQDNVEAWRPNVRYTRGQIVSYKNNFWQAATIVPAKDKFEYTDWLKSNYDRIEQGLLQNLATKADQLANSYDTQTANLNLDNDLLAFGLIGFRPRQYMVDLNLDDTSQVNLYQQFIKTKGTTQATDLFTQVNFDPLTAQYRIYENWGILAGTYGANANRSWFEITLDEALLTGNPSTVQIIEPGQASQANQTVQLNNLWAESYKITDINILPTTTVTNSDTALPSAGYVNIDSVDITVFSLNDPASIGANLEIVGNGTKIWVAKANSYDWNIYECAQIPGRLTQLTDNLNGTSRAQFSNTVDLDVGDLIIVRYFSESVDGVYRVLSRPSIDTAVIQFEFTNSNQTTITGTGLVFYLQSMRVAQASDIVNLPRANQLTPGVTVWVDNDGTGHWQVLEKTNPFAAIDTVTAIVPEPNSLFGASLAQSSDRYALLVGAPATANGAGAVYTYRLGNVDDYLENTELLLTATGTVGFGNSVDFGNRTWAVAGASASNSGAGYVAILYLVPGTNNYAKTQLLVNPTQDFGPVGFGSTVKITADERWMYVSAPAANEVYAYARIDVPRQSVTYTAPGNVATFTYNNDIEIDSLLPDQLIVTVDNLLAVYGRDYVINATLVQFLSTPTAGSKIVISRRTAVQLDSNTYYNINQNSTSGAGSGAAFTINNTRGVYSVSLTAPGTGYAVADTLIISYTQVDPTGSAANNITITVTEVTSGGITGFTRSGTGVTNNTVFALDTYLYTATNLDSFTVEVNGVLQRPHIDYDFQDPGDSSIPEITFLTVPAAGAIITVTSASVGAYWKYVNTMTVTGIGIYAGLGTSLSTDVLGRQILIGAPGDNAVDAAGDTILSAGAVHAFDRGVLKYIITDVEQLTYAIPVTAQDPITVILNNQYLTNTAQYINGDFTVVGNTIVLSPSISLTIGDSLVIETNEFQQVQKITANTVIDQSLFGQSVVICPNSCSVYTGAPLDSSATGVPQAGLVQRQVNQSRIYGITTSTVANPGLTAGDSLRINNQEVLIPSAPNNTVAGLVSAINSSGIPNVRAASSRDVILQGNGATKIFDIGNLYSSATAYTTVVYIDDVLQTQGVNYTYNNTTQQLIFVSAPADGSEILVVGGRITISVINTAAAVEFNRLTVLPGLTAGTAFDNLGFVTYAYTQTIVSPRATDFAQFGSSISINSSADNLVVGSPNGDAYEPTTFDAGETYFDDRSTTFFSSVSNSGVVYTFDYLPSATDSVTNPGQLVFGQQVYTNQLQTGDQFGAAVNYRSNRLSVGAPGSDLGDSSVNYGSVAVLDNDTGAAVWQVVYTQQPSVDVNLINSVYSYDRGLSSTQTYFDFIDPLQGKILGVARRNIDYIGAVDPASYNTGTIHNIGTSWSAAHVGEIWWDTNSVRFIDANQDNLVYASRRWGQVFPGSTIDCYQWTANSVPPVNYAGTGVPLSATSYTVASTVDDQGLLVTTYFYWVRGINTVATQAGKTLSVTAVASYILNPVSSGLPYMAALSANAVALYNAKDLLSGSDTILHIEYDRQAQGGQSDIHQEYEFIAQGRADSFLNANLYRKMLDSFSGATTTGGAVPDPLLSPGMQHGVQFRPRQSMFVNRFGALQNYLGRANTVLAQYPIAETRTFSLLNSSEPIPASNSGAWDFEVANLEVLAFQNLAVVPLGWKYLVTNDSGQSGRWTIYQVAAGTLPGSRVLDLVQVQTYDTTLYWDYIDWYLPGYNSSIQPVATVTNVADLQQLNLNTAPVGSSVKVTTNGQGKFSIYLRTATGWDRVGLEDGTIAFDQVLWNYVLGGFGFDAQVFDSTYFDQEPTTETRNIIRAINEELFVDDLLIERNQSLILMFQYIYSEFTSPNWLFKSSYITVDHVIRGLEPYELYQPDNQTFVLDYLNEVKPYHVQNLSFNLIYEGLDTYPGGITDYDVPARWDTALAIPQFVSPVLTPYTLSDSVNQSVVSDTASDAQIWLQRPWSDWFNRYGLSVESVTVIDTTTTYSAVPTITIGTEWTANTTLALSEQIFYGANLYTVTTAGTTGVTAPRFTVGSLANGTATLTYSGARAQAVAVLRANQTIATVTVTVPGTGYLTTPPIAITDVNDSSATYGYQLVPVMGNNLVRSIKTTIKYDRYQYSSDLVEWSYLTANYAAGTQVRYQDLVWSADTAINNTAITTTATAQSASFSITVASVAGLTPGMLITANTQLLPDTAIGTITGTTLQLTRATLGALNNTQVNFYRPFDVDQWTRVDADTLSGVDRTMGFYAPTANMPGLSLPLLIDGIDYPGVQVDAPDFNQNTGFDVGNYDINPFDNISFDAEGRPTYDPGILDAKYSSSYLDPYLGTRATDINVVGGAYIDTYSSHAPEELIPGSEFDTLDLRVYTRPGSDWLQQGHGFPSGTVRYELDPANLTLSFAGLEPYTALVFVSNLTQQLDLHPGTDYTVNYVDQTVTMILGGNVQAGDVIVITAYEVGGGNQLYKDVYNGADIGNTVTVPVAYYQIDGVTPEIQEFVIFVNGVLTTNYTYEALGDRATTVTFGVTYTATDSIALYVLAPTVIVVDQPPVDYSWSLPQTQIIVSDGTGLTFDLDNSLSGCNPDCLIVTVNGVRARTSAGIRHTADGSTGYDLPGRLGVSQSLIADNQVHVYVEDQPQVLGVDFTVEPASGYSEVREVLFAEEPEIGAEILIYVDINVQCFVNGTQLTFVAGNGLEPGFGDVIAVTTWNDTRQQGILSQCFVGPVTIGSTTVNNLDMGVAITNPDRLWVSLNGDRLFNNQGFVISGTEVILASGVMDVSDVVMITQFTNYVVPEAMAFRIFQDMRGVQATYRITTDTTTETTALVAVNSDVISVVNAGALPEPDFNNNVWGVITINAERIMYRTRDTATNTVSGLLRGTAGTGVSAHAANSTVYNLGRGNLLPQEYQDYVVSNTFEGDDTTTEFTATLIDLAQDDSTLRVDTLEVYVGGTKQSEHFIGDGVTKTFTLNDVVATPDSVVTIDSDLQDPTINYTISGPTLTFVTAPALESVIVVARYSIVAISPVQIIFETAPASGVEVALLVRRGVTWYAPGIATASNGEPLQITDTAAARFLRGL